MRRAGAIAAASFGLLLLVRAGAALRPFPRADLAHGPAQSSRISDRTGVVLREVVGDGGVRARWVPISEIPPRVVAATLAAEDRRFHRHGGVDLVAAVRAAGQNLAARRVVSGASTLTMQLARLVRGHGHSAAGKLAQAFDAWRIEAALGKAEILEQYLNRAPYGAGTVGVEAASERYFGKPVQHLSLAEAALLAGLPQAPTTLNPLRGPERAVARQRVVLARMRAEGLATREEVAAAAAEPLRFAAAPPAPVAMHFTDWVLSGRTGPGDVRTTLDLELQRQVEGLATAHVRALSRGGLTQAAVVVLDNATCDVLAMVGSTDYWSGRAGSVNGALAPRQPGSALKPFVYALAFDRGFTPASVVADVPTQYLDARGLVMRPRNYSERFSGPVLMGEALGRSLNVPALRVANAVGLPNVVAALRDLGFTSLDRSAEHYGLGVALGNGEVTLVELAQAYAALARGGVTCRARARADAPVDPGKRVFSEPVSFLVGDVLADEGLRARAFGAANPLLLGFPIAVKTGTSTNWRDNWAAGYTDRHTVAVWTGDFAGNPMNQLSGAIGAGPLFAGVARLLVQRGAVPHVPRPPVAPDGVERAPVCPLSGMAPGPHCPAAASVWVPAGGAHRRQCTWHRKVRIDRRNGLLASDRCPDALATEQVFEVLPPAYAEWEAEHTTMRPPTRWSPACPAQGPVADAVVITHPRDRDVFVLEPGYDRATQSVRLTAEVDPAAAEIAWLVDGERVALVRWPYEASLPLTRGAHRVEASAEGRRSQPVRIEVR
ncbi:MAG TPA: penicillin-binding protein 1C [Anaeromyxobacter sp.]|nr:penicillin-binding protein 1C [Anaeromyxobacter sp.]